MKTAQLRLYVPSFGFDWVTIEYEVNSVGSPQPYTLGRWSRTDSSGKLIVLDPTSVIRMNESMERIQQRLLEKVLGANMKREPGFKEEVWNPASIYKRKKPKPAMTLVTEDTPELPL